MSIVPDHEHPGSSDRRDPPIAPALEHDGSVMTTLVEHGDVDGARSDEPREPCSEHLATVGGAP